VLIVRLAKNYPLSGGNKRESWVAVRVFIEINGWSWSKYPSVDDAEQVVLAIASGGWDEDRVAEWLGDHLAFDQEQ
jgi:death-on-curing protein